MASPNLNIKLAIFLTLTASDAVNDPRHQLHWLAEPRWQALASCLAQRLTVPGPQSVVVGEATRVEGTVDQILFRLLPA